MKNRLALVLLSVLLFAVTVVLYSAEMGRPGAGARMGRMQHLGGGSFGNEQMIGGFGFFKMADKFELTDPQLLAMRAWYQKNEKTMNAGKERLKMFKKLSDPTLSEEDVKKIAAEEGKAVEESIIGRFQMMQELRKILTPDQLKKLQEGRRPPMMNHREFSPSRNFRERTRPNIDESPKCE